MQNSVCFCGLFKNVVEAEFKALNDRTVIDYKGRGSINV